LEVNILFLARYSASSPVHDLLALAAKGDRELLPSDYAFEEARRNLALKSPGDSVERLEAITPAISRVQEASGVGAQASTRGKVVGYIR
jgi:hypothetical protein